MRIKSRNIRNMQNRGGIFIQFLEDRKHTSNENGYIWPSKNKTCFLKNQYEKKLNYQAYISGKTNVPIIYIKSSKINFLRGN